MPLSRNDFNNIDSKTFNYEKIIETVKLIFISSQNFLY
jgi:hypothetical protein